MLEYALERGSCLILTKGSRPSIGEREVGEGNSREWENIIGWDNQVRAG